MLVIFLLFLNRWGISLCSKNNIEFNVKVRYIETGITRAEFAQKIESTNSYANRIDKKKTV